MCLSLPVCWTRTPPPAWPAVASASYDQATALEVQLALSFIVNRDNAMYCDRTHYCEHLSTANASEAIVAQAVVSNIILWLSV